MVDFTSSLYLGMRHKTAELLKWSQLTTGVPAALWEPVKSREIGRAIAHMQGLETGRLAPSTLHLYWDLYGFLSNQNITVFIDEKAYPVSMYGVERLSVKNVPVYFFQHLNAKYLSHFIRTKLKTASTPVVITDGWCTHCGQAAPLAEYAEMVSRRGGYIIIDDTQAFGILGEKITNAAYGNGGGGTLKWLNVDGPCIISIVSLAKGFGVPIAAISGNKTFISEFIDRSETRVHSSPVSIADLHAAINALSNNFFSGEERRKKLLNNVVSIKKGLNQLGISLTGGMFPFQTINNLPPNQISNLFQKLTANGIKAILTANHINSLPVLSFLINSTHVKEELQALISSVKKYSFQ